MTISLYTSTIHDGSMKPLHDTENALVSANRETFLLHNAINPADTTLVQITYETDDFRRYFTLDDGARGDGITRQATIEADALVVTKPNHALLLPLADCIGAVIHDPTRDILMLSHLGRHNLEQYGGTKSIEYLAAKHDCDPQDLTVWLSSAAGRDNYPLYTFDNRSLHDVATEQLITAGVLVQNITTSPIDSAADTNYFSHSQFLAGNRDSDGRFAVVAALR